MALGSARPRISAPEAPKSCSGYPRYFFLSATKLSLLARGAASTSPNIVPTKIRQTLKIETEQNRVQGRTASKRKRAIHTL